MSIYITIYTKEYGRQKFTESEWDSRWRTIHSRTTNHRVDGPAVEWADGSKWWMKEGKYHRLDGPAIDRANGDKDWYVEGQFHREDGPARIWYGGQHWYIEGNPLSKLSKKYLIRYMELKNLTVAHLLTDPDDMIRNSAEKFKWKEVNRLALRLVDPRKWVREYDK